MLQHGNSMLILGFNNLNQLNHLWQMVRMVNKSGFSTHTYFVNYMVLQSPYIQWIMVTHGFMIRVNQDQSGTRRHQGMRSHFGHHQAVAWAIDKALLRKVR